ncbi:hypothetical protein JW949_02770 [Candidatus Woesearchaeota archaeon]|nr:hypothetical protein [Candidatus Woesearchaeota archaeon]
MNLFKKIKSNIRKSENFAHETKRSVTIKFISVILIFVFYFFFVSIRYNHWGDGFIITLLTWSFFVFCTPIADAGVLIDFPIRLITKIRMIYSEILVWITALSINIYSLTFMPQLYEKTIVLRLFNHILLQPFPFWSIILISGLGTFLSIHFGDELLDISKHRERKKYILHEKKHKWILIIFIIVSILILYDFLLKEFGIHIV